MTREEQLAHCAEQLIATIEDIRNGSIFFDEMEDYFDEIFTLALAGQLIIEE